MPPKMKASSVKALTSKKSVPKTKKITTKKPLPTKTKTKSGAVTKIPKNKKKAEPEPSASSSFCSRTEENENSDKGDIVVTPKMKFPKNKKKLLVEPVPSTSTSFSGPTEENEHSEKKDIVVTPKMMKQCLNAYKLSPDYANLKKKRFNTGFIFERRRGERDIQIFTPEEENSPKWKENLPEIKNKIQIQGEPGAAYANIFKDIPIDISDSEEDEEPKKKVQTKRKCPGKRGRKKSVGYKGVPLPDECLLTNYAELFKSP